MSKGCVHIAGSRGRHAECARLRGSLTSGSEWLHLRICRTCGHVGCCDDTPNRHATAHFHAAAHPVIEGYDPLEDWDWGWCYVDKVPPDCHSRMRSLAQARKP